MFTISITVILYQLQSELRSNTLQFTQILIKAQLQNTSANVIF